MDHADDDVGGHVVGVVPAPEAEVGDVGEVEGAAEDGPEAQEGAVAGAVEAGDADEGVVHAVEDAGAGAEVVELLGGAEVARVEDGAEDPGDGAEVGEDLVVPPQGVARGHALAQPRQTVPVRRQVTDAEEHGEGLLEPEDAHEGPLPVELGHAAARLHAPRGHDVLAGVVAFLRARPEEEAEVEGYRRGKKRRGADVSILCVCVYVWPFDPGSRLGRWYRLGFKFGSRRAKNREPRTESLELRDKVVAVVAVVVMAVVIMVVRAYV